MTDRLTALARRVSNDPLFLGWLMREFAHSERLDEEGLAGALDCPVEALIPLRLCRRPRAEPIHFRSDVDRIAQRFNVSAEALATIIRHVDAVETMRRPLSGEQGLLIAARDRDVPTNSLDDPDKDST